MDSFAFDYEKRTGKVFRFGVGLSKSDGLKLSSDA
jgi:hypothetical protein